MEVRFGQFRPPNSVTFRLLSQRISRGELVRFPFTSRYVFVSPLSSLLLIPLRNLHHWVLVFNPTYKPMYNLYCEIGRH